MATLLRVRQAEFASAKGYKEPDAWDFGVVEPDVPIDIHTQLTDNQFDNAWKRWRVQWQERTPLTDKQKQDQMTMNNNRFNKQMRSAFGAYLNNLMGEPHVAKLIIRNGVGPKDDVFSIKEFSG